LDNFNIKGTANHTEEDKHIKAGCTVAPGRTCAP